MPQGGLTPGFQEVPASPEQQAEAPETGASFESAPATSERPGETAPSVPTSIAAAPAVVVPAKDPTVRAVEAILEDDLGDTFKNMPPQLQAKFRAEGERVGGIIATMVRAAKVNARIVLKLIGNWLKLIPGVNRFFLTQEAKIKTDRILKL